MITITVTVTVTIMPTMRPASRRSHDDSRQGHAADIQRRFANRQATTGQIIMFGLTGGLVPCPASIRSAAALPAAQAIRARRHALVLCFSDRTRGDNGRRRRGGPRSAGDTSGALVGGFTRSRGARPMRLSAYHAARLAYIVLVGVVELATHAA